MSYRFKAGYIGILLGIFAASLLIGQVQKGSSSARAYEVPRTLDGQPDFQGIWTSATLTPLERPLELKDKAFLTEQEAAEYEKQSLRAIDADRPENDLGSKGPHAPTANLSYNELWRERGGLVATRRTSLIVDPPDGRIPPLTPEGKRRADARAEARKLHGTDGPEDQDPVFRCLVSPGGGPPMMPRTYNANYQFVQAPGYVLILSEEIHDARVIPLDGRPHLAPTVQQWKGDSRGIWQGKTLVVETTNFTDQTNFAGSSDALRLVERFTRTNPDLILYEFTVDDPATFTRPWTVQLPLTRAKGPIFEYACHEGNYGMANVLSGARAAEKAAPKP
jgi:hypothetical protein